MCLWGDGASPDENWQILFPVWPCSSLIMNVDRYKSGILSLLVTLFSQTMEAVKEANMLANTFPSLKSSRIRATLAFWFVNSMLTLLALFSSLSTSSQRTCLSSLAANYSTVFTSYLLTASVYTRGLQPAALEPHLALFFPISSSYYFKSCYCKLLL